MWRLVVITAVLAGCGGDREVELALTSDCTSAELSGVTILSVEVLGIHEGEPCALSRRCLFDVDPIAGVDDVVAALQDAQSPLIDIPDEGAHTVAIIGHADSCWSNDDHLMCGFGDLAEVRDGVLDIALGCDCTGNTEILFCP